MKMTYVHNPDFYTDDLHACWMHLFQHLDSLNVTAMKEDESVVEFIPVSQEAERLIQFLSDCDFGLIMTEEQRRYYEEENGPLF